MKKWMLGISLLLLISCSVILLRSERGTHGYRVMSEKKWTNVKENGTEKELNLELTYKDSPLACDRESKTFYLPLAMEEDAFVGKLAGMSDGIDCDLFIQSNLANEDITAVQKANSSIPILAVRGKDWEEYYIKITGVPIMSFSATDALTQEALPVFSLAVYDTDPARDFYTSCFTSATLHGNTSLAYEKKSLRLKLLKQTDEGYQKANRNLLGLRDDNDWVLNSLYADENRVRDKLSIDLWNELGANSNPFGKSFGTDAEFCEVFINDAYQGLYLLMVPIDAKQLGMQAVSKQIEKGDAVIERLYKKKYTAEYHESDFVGELPDPNMPNYRAGYYLKGDTVLQNEEEWEPLRMLSHAIEAEDDCFKAEIASLVDTQNVVENWLFFQAIGAFDNAYKNVYFAYRQNGEGAKGYFIPWDLNISFGCVYADNAFYCETDPTTLTELVCWEPGQRMIETDSSESILLAKNTWQNWREGVLSDEAFCERARKLESTLKDSGAFAREMERFPEGNCNEDFSLITDYGLKRLAFIDEYLSKLSK